MELDHLALGYPKLSDFVRSLGGICRMKIVPVGRGPATHMVLLPPLTTAPTLTGGAEVEALTIAGEGGMGALQREREREREPIHLAACG